MHHFSVLLAEAGILDFDAKDNYIRCFAHIINLCAQATIKAMEKDDSREIHSETDTETESDDEDLRQVAHPSLPQNSGLYTEVWTASRRIVEDHQRGQ